jgi:DNA-binding LytR/AlgR family response regulator
MKYKCIITDDEPLAHNVLRAYIQSNEQLILVKQCYSAAEARFYLANNSIDILFLDIEMPEETGISLLQSLPQKPITIFTTAFLHYSLEGFELGVMDYLVKPVREERFKLAVSRAIEFLQLLELKSDLEKNEAVHSQLIIKTGNKRVTVDRNTVTHVQALKDYSIIYCGEKKYVVRSTMKEMEELLGSDGFLRVHKSFIVARHKIQMVSAATIEFNQYEIPVGRKYKSDVNACILNNPTTNEYF